MSDNSNTNAKYRLYKTFKWFIDNYSWCKRTDKTTSTKCKNTQFSANCLISQLSINRLIANLCFRCECTMLSFPDKFSSSSDCSDWKQILFFGPCSRILSFSFTSLWGYPMSNFSQLLKEFDFKWFSDFIDSIIHKIVWDTRKYFNIVKKHTRCRLILFYRYSNCIDNHKYWY